MGVDFDAVRANAAKEGIPLNEIAIVYRNLTEIEIAQMQEFCLITHPSEDSVIAKFMEDGTAMFPGKAEAVLYLAA